jgi:predicted RNA-binding Zn ribbon-like protein
MSSSRVSPYLPSFIGGAVCLDFVNTVDPRHADERDDWLRNYQQLVRWGGQAHLLTPEECSELELRSLEEPSLADAVHQRALELREALYRLFATQPSAETMARRSGDPTRLTDEARRAWAMMTLAPAEDGWSWQWDTTAELDRILWPVARSASELLPSSKLSRIRECEGPSGCGWLFLDTSKNGRRRWCDMRVCGNRAKARRHRQRNLANPGSSQASR